MNTPLRIIYEQILSSLLTGKQKNELRILDAGCGDGRFLGYLAEKGYGQLHGTDYSKRALSFARLLAPGAIFHHGDLMGSLPFEDGSFDVLFFIETLEHIPPANIPTVISNLRRIMKPSGSLIVTVPSILQGMTSNSKHYQHFSEDLLRKTLEPAFIVTEIRGQNKHGFNPLKLLYFLLDNPYWKIPPILSLYNTRIWPKLFNTCRASEGRRLIAIAHPR